MSRRHLFIFNKMKRFYPKRLEEIGGIFEYLEKGESVQLLPPEERIVFSPVPSEEEAWVGVTSSGSTGIPKLAWRRWKELKGAASRSERIRGWRWATPYEPWSFAGIQVAVQAFVSGGEAISLQGDWEEIWRILEERGVDAISATPTFLDLLLQNEPEGGVNWTPRHITLGGEPLREGVGRRVQERWPGCGFRVIYAAAEFGVIATSSRYDGWYPVKSLEKRWPRWRVVDGVLELERNGVWRSTGDQVEVKEGWFRVIGRADRVVNVGGVKVNLESVGAAAEAVQGIRRAQAFAVPNPITGEVVGLRYEIEEGYLKEEVQKRLEEYLRSVLPKVAWPRRWEVGKIELGSNAKRKLL